MDTQQFQSDLEQAKRRLAGVVLRTPVVPCKTQPGVWLKAENLQLTGSFKLRAAYNQLAALDEETLRRGIVTSSSGNFAQGTAYAAKLLEASAKVVMMRSSRATKVEKTRAFGGEVVFCEDRFEAREETVRQIAELEGRAVIFPYDHCNAIAGNATAALEVLEDLPEMAALAVPVSGGGLISGLALAIKSLRPEIPVYGVQAEGSNATYLSFRKGVPTSIERAETIADGLMVTAPGKLTFPIIQQYVDDMVLVSEQEILAATRALLIAEKLVVEPSGAVPLAAVLAKRLPAEGTVCFLSGGNMDLGFMRDLCG
jgi:threonine dehydratase